MEINLNWLFFTVYQKVHFTSFFGGFFTLWETSVIQSKNLPDSSIHPSLHPSVHSFVTTNVWLHTANKNPHRKDKRKKKKEVNVENKCHMSEQVNLIWSEVKFDAIYSESCVCSISVPPCHIGYFGLSVKTTPIPPPPPPPPTHHPCPAHC